MYQNRELESVMVLGLDRDVGRDGKRICQIVNVLGLEDWIIKFISTKKKKVRRGIGKTPTGLFTEKPHPITRKEEIGAGCTIN